ncbi:hypothetical protein K7H99_21900 (plasmid) [Providencia rettgeri]|uniref:hypothetical protein n=1 Tax=Providencia rettgeri TaxID=587 RepID=UPI001CA6F3DC|nr:hypothetical protein [Providencia rettgeri]QZY66770.1 hypothetical protein K7H99_21900 [Providencia rettgeri]
MLSTIFIVFVVVILCLGLIIVATSKASEATSVFALMILLIAAVIFGAAILNEEDKSEVVSKGEYYSTKCQLIETNNDNGLFQSNTNKLKCGDVIENVTVSDYKEAIEAYQNSNVQMNKLN